MITAIWPVRGTSRCSSAMFMNRYNEVHVRFTGNGCTECKHVQPPNAPPPFTAYPPSKRRFMMENFHLAAYHFTSLTAEIQRRPSEKKRQHLHRNRTRSPIFACHGLVPAQQAVGRTSAPGAHFAALLFDDIVPIPSPFFPARGPRASHNAGGRGTSQSIVESIQTERVREGVQAAVSRVPGVPA